MSIGRSYGMDDMHEERVRCGVSPQGANSADSKKIAADTRAQRVREKNRRAQHRYRERCKERDAQLAQQAKDLTRELARVLDEKQLLEVQTQFIGRLVNQKEAICLAQEEPFVPSEGFGTFVPQRRSGLLLKAAFDPPRRLTHQQVIQLSLDDHQAISEATVCRARQLLPLCQGGDLNSVAGRQLMALIQEKHGFAAYIAGHNAMLMHRLLFLRCRDSTLGSSTATLVFWDGIRRRLGLSQEQKQYLHETRCRFLYNSNQLFQERAELQNKVKDMEVHDQSVGRGGGCNYTQWAQLAQALQDNCDKEHVLHCRFYACLFLKPHGITPLQEAQLMVECHPHYHDMLAILQGLETELPVQPLLLDTDADVEGLLPRTGELPDPTVERYVPVDLKMVRSIFSNNLFIRERAAT